MFGRNPFLDILPSSEVGERSSDENVEKVCEDNCAAGGEKHGRADKTACW